MKETMKQIIKDTIMYTNFNLEEKLFQIDAQEIKGNISKEEKQELEQLAREHAKHENGYASSLEQRVATLEKKVQELEKANTTDEPIEDDEQVGEEVEEYKEWTQPLGAHDAYKEGDKVMFNGKKYVCLRTGSTYNPVVYPADWKEVI